MLCKLAEMGICSRVVKTSTEYLAQRMGSSQQTASRHLIELVKLGWIKRRVTHDGCLIEITDTGKSELKNLCSTLSRMLEPKTYQPVTIEGHVFTGLGEGAYYVSKELYRKQFKDKLGFDPYPGTLNIKLTSEYDIMLRREIDSYPAIKIEGFKNEDRNYGDGRCYPAIIENKFKGAVVSAMRTHYDSTVVEVLSPVYLRGKLKLKDGQKIRVEVYPANSESLKE
ncbi:MAG: DUF120 domain-containing protein [Candidatus Bathyarchaeia archaeon]